jgi:hypothetical protein
MSDYSTGLPKISVFVKIAKKYLKINSNPA